MPLKVEIRGTAEFRATAAKLRAAGQGAVVREMAKKMRETAKPAVEAAQRSVTATEASGSRGGGGQARRAFTVEQAGRRRAVSEATKRRAFKQRGLRATVARTIKAKVKTGARSAVLQIRSDAKRMPHNQRSLPEHMNTGKWRHPVFNRKLAGGPHGRGHGRGKVWVTQTVTPPGWFDRPMSVHGRRVHKAAISVVDDINRKIAS